MAGIGGFGGIGFQGLGPGFMPAGVPGQFVLPQGAGPGTPVIGNGNPLPTVGGAAPQGGGGGGGLSFPTTWGEFGGSLRGIGSWLLNNPEVPLAVVGGIAGHNAQRDANRNDQRALALLEERQRQLAPLSQMGIQGLMGGSQRPDLSYLTDRANPYAGSFSPVGHIGGGGAAPSARTRTRRA